MPEGCGDWAVPCWHRTDNEMRTTQRLIEFNYGTIYPDLYSVLAFSPVKDYRLGASAYTLITDLLIATRNLGAMPKMFEAQCTGTIR